ncbi:MAG: peptidoglycan-associated lipoprotein Pal [Rhodovibrionaceae bacterium]
MRFKLLMVLAAGLMLAACGSSDREAAPTTTGGNTTGSTVSSGAAPGSQEQLVQQVGDRVFFDTDRSEIKPQARSTIEALAAWMNEHPGVALTVEGHCDERGTREYNLALGERRANAVRDYLVALGISGNRVGTISYGKERPAVPGSSESAWAQNRRGVFVVR